MLGIAFPIDPPKDSSGDCYKAYSKVLTLGKCSKNNSLLQGSLLHDAQIRY